jgi:hypothetical protein
VQRYYRDVDKLLLLNPEFKREIEDLAQELEEQLSASDPDWQLKEALKDAVARVYKKVPIGAEVRKVIREPPRRKRRIKPIYAS